MSWSTRRPARAGSRRPSIAARSTTRRACWCAKLLPRPLALSHIHNQGSYLPFLSNLYTTDALQELRFDRSRNTLYALAASSTIQCFWLGRDGKTLERCATRSNLQDDAICRERIHNPASAEFQICSIWPVTAAESSRFHLLALTTSGVRIYLTTMPNPSDKPYTLQVVHVDNALRDLRGSHSAVQASFFAYGCLLLSTSPGGGASLAAPDAERPLYCLHFNTASKEQRTINVDEPYQCLRLSGTTWAIGETPLPAIVAASEIVPTVVPPVNVANELATQHFIQRRFLCLTHRGIYTVERRRPVDQLALCLTQSQGSVDAQELHSFFGSYKSGAEAYAMCLMLACQRPDTPHLASADAGGAAASAAAAGGSGWVGATLQIRDYATSAFLHFEPKGNRAAGAGGANVGVMLGQQQQTSERYQGFCAYLARLLAPVWHVPINRITVYTKEEVRGFRDSLVNLMFFVEQTRWGGGDSVLAGVGGGGGGGGGDGGGRIAGATETPHPFPLRVLDSLHTRTRNQQDQLSLPHLVTLLNRAIQALNMLIVLNEHDVTIIDRLSTDAKITAAPFADLVAGQAGVTIVKLLVGFLMKAYTEETDQMSKDLSRDCPLYFNQADRDYFLAVKRLREAGLQQNHTARVELQEEALKLFRGIAAGLPFADAFAVIAEMQAQGFTAGVVEVAMLACSSREKQRPADKDDRLRCCAVIEDAFETLLSRLAPSEQGLLARVAPDAPWAEPAVDLYRRLKRLVLQGGSEECRMHLFGWYLATGKLAELTEVESPLLEAFLRANDPVFLAEYYTANHRYADAATAYLALAEAPTPAGGRDLNQRILYLGHAVANVKQADGRGVSEGQVFGGGGRGAARAPASHFTSFVRCSLLLFVVRFTGAAADGEAGSGDDPAPHLQRVAVVRVRGWSPTRARARASQPGPLLHLGAVQPVCVAAATVGDVPDDHVHGQPRVPAHAGGHHLDVHRAPGAQAHTVQVGGRRRVLAVAQGGERGALQVSGCVWGVLLLKPLPTPLAAVLFRPRCFPWRPSASCWSSSRLRCCAARCEDCAGAAAR